MAPTNPQERMAVSGFLAVPPRTQGGDESEVSSVNSLSPLSPDSSEKYAVSPCQLSELHDPKSLGHLHALGGIKALLHLLNVNTRSGVDGGDAADIELRTSVYGRNRLPERLQRSFLRLCFEAMKDKVLILLLVAAIISLALGLYETLGEPVMYDDEHMPIPKVDWVEGVAIIAAVAIVVLVGAANDYQKERQFARLNAKKEDREVIVIRNGSQEMVSIYDLVVGDIINLQTGDVVPADAVLVLGDLECDELALTGESDTIMKVPAKQALHYYESQLPTDADLGSAGTEFKDPYLISGATVLSGLGNAVVTAVGENSIHGRTMMSLAHEPETTPLQERLNNLAEGISKYGFLAALVLFVVLFIRYCVNIAPGGKFNLQTGAEKGKKFLDILIVAITIVVVAVPEGLPLAVTLALAFATTRMAQNGNLVRVLRSCETMGRATAICSDKTGTLTENSMRVVRAYFGGCVSFEEPAEATAVMGNLSADQRQYIGTNVTVNSTAFTNVNYDAEKAQQARQKPPKKTFLQQLFTSSEKAQQQHMGVVLEPYLGNKTELALLILAASHLGLYDSVLLEHQREALEASIVQVIPFESARKWAGVVMRIENGFRLYAKGAAEILYKNCGYHCVEGAVVKMDRDSRDHGLQCIDSYANDALRAIVLAHQDFVGVESWPPAEAQDPSRPYEANPDALVSLQPEDMKKALVLDTVVGIQDPLKEGVPESVLQCQRAGVTVRMVTGDNLITAKAILRGCHILTPHDLDNEHACMEGPAFRKLSPDERARIAPGLRVLARSSPEDKRLLVETLKHAGDVVAVTGDGTNDAPALKLADVGFSMGISGTEVAREASDIILMTDDFTDIVQAIKWGRTVETSIKKFIQFQLTVNITACVLTFVSSVASSNGQSVLTAVQLLWVNLIMDTLAALALATDKPDESLLNRKPTGRKAPLISVSMWKMIIGQSLTQLVVTFILHFGGPRLFLGSSTGDNHQDKQLDALTFNTFVWLQFFKLIVTRKLDEADGISSVRGRISRDNLDFTQHLFRNWYFITIALIIAAVQVLVMFVGGAAFTIVRQTSAQWAVAILCGFISIPVGALIRIVPNEWVLAVFPTRAFKTFIYYVGFEFLRKEKYQKRRARDLEKNEETSESKESEATV